MRIGIVAPSRQLDASVPDRLIALAKAQFGEQAPELTFHPQCFLSDGHFAGPDAARIEALVDMANDPSIDAIWFARGGYGACRVAEEAIAQFGKAAHDKIYFGYSDAGFLLAGLMKAGIGRPVHGPLAADILREGGEATVLRALNWLRDPQPYANDGERYAAFNLMVLSKLIGTPLQPDLSGHILMVEEISEYMYSIDRCLFQITSNPNIQRIKGFKLGRCLDVPDNDPDFVHDEEQIARFWCEKYGIPYLGRANIGHDVDNAVVPLGAFTFR